MNPPSKDQRRSRKQVIGRPRFPFTPRIYAEIPRVNREGLSEASARYLRDQLINVSENGVVRARQLG